MTPEEPALKTIWFIVVWFVVSWEGPKLAFHLYMLNVLTLQVKEQLALTMAAEPAFAGGPYVITFIVSFQGASFSLLLWENFQFLINFKMLLEVI